MKRAIRIGGLILAALTVSTVAMAQAGGNGGNGGGGGGGAGGGEGGGGDNSIIELRLQDHERARLTRAVEPRRGSANCLSHVCNEPRRTHRRPAELARLNESCSGGEYLMIRNRYGQVIRYVCETR